MNKKTPLYEGKAKTLYEGPEPGTLIAHFKDDATAFNNEKQGTVIGKGILNNRISEFLMTKIEEMGIDTHFIKSLNMREQLVKAVDIIPIEVVIRNITAGSLTKRFGVEEGMQLPQPLIEFYLKSDELGDPMVSEEHITMFSWADPMELEEIKILAIRINDFLSGLFMGVGIKLVDFKVEFGRVYDEEGNIYILLADEISPDSCRLWDLQTGQKMDKDRFRHDMGNVEEAYQEVARRLGVLIDETEPAPFEPKPKKVGKKKPVKKATSNRAKTGK
jgi:phosphoribosylaminoimidazole-succinocarboxamide synthase